MKNFARLALLSLALLATSACDVATLSVSITTTSPLPGATVGTPYSQTLTATGGIAPYSWSVASGTLPAGLALSAAGGISGTPTATGTATFTVKAVDSASPPNSTTRDFTLAVQAASLTPIISTTSPLPGATLGIAYSQILTATGGTAPYSWSVATGSTLPPGMTLSIAGLLSGTPTVVGATTFLLTVTDSASNAESKAFTVTILDGNALYSTNCSACHGATVAGSTKRGRTAAQIEAAIFNNTGGMGTTSLRALTTDQIQAIANVLN